MKICFFDTNILVRYFLRDVEEQYLKIVKVLKSIENGKSLGKLSVLVIAEAVWVLGSVYKLDRNIFIPQILDLVALKNIKIVEQDKNLVIRVLEKFEKVKFDFIDVYLSEIANQKELLTFDKDFQKLYK